jgi:hypothetical protein
MPGLTGGSEHLDVSDRRRRGKGVGHCVSCDNSARECKTFGKVERIRIVPKSIAFF